MPAKSSTVTQEVIRLNIVLWKKNTLTSIAMMMPIEAIMKKAPKPERSRLVT